MTAIYGFAARVRAKPHSTPACRLRHVHSSCHRRAQHFRTPLPFFHFRPPHTTPPPLVHTPHTHAHYPHHPPTPPTGPFPHTHAHTPLLPTHTFALPFLPHTAGGFSLRVPPTPFGTHTSTAGHFPPLRAYLCLPGALPCHLGSCMCPALVHTHVTPIRQDTPTDGGYYRHPAFRTELRQRPGHHLPHKRLQLAAASRHAAPALPSLPFTTCSTFLFCTSDYEPV